MRDTMMVEPYRHKVRAFSLITTVVLSLCTSSSEVQASGFSTARFGGEHGNPVTTNPTAIYYNPAGIGMSQDIHIFLDGNFAVRAGTYSHDLTPEEQADEPVDARGANAGKATLLNFAAAPMLGATFKLGNLALGAGAYIPFGGSSSWDKNEIWEANTKYPGPVDGVQRWFAIEGTLLSFYVTGAAAYHIKPARLSIGASGNLVLSSINTIRARTTDGSSSVTNEGRSYLNVSGTSFSFGVGGMFEAIPEELWFGLSYQSRPGISGGTKLKGTLKNKLGKSPQSETDVAMNQDLPDIFRLGVRYRPTTEVELRLFGDLTRWSAFSDQCLAAPDAKCEVDEKGVDVEGANSIQNIPRRWNDAFGIRVGASYWMKPSLELFTGLGYDSNAVPDSTLDPSLTDFHDIGLSGGVRFQVGTVPVFVALSYTHLFYITRDNKGKSELTQFESKSRSPDAGGEYTQTVGVLNVNLDVAF